MLQSGLQEIFCVWKFEVLSSLIFSSAASLLIEECACAKVQKRYFSSSDSCGIFIDFRNWGAIKKAFRILYTIGPLTKVNLVLFLRNKLFSWFVRRGIFYVNKIIIVMRVPTKFSKLKNLQNFFELRQKTFVKDLFLKLLVE